MPNQELLIKFEQAELDQDGVATLFQDMIDTEEVWQLGGSYARTALQLIAMGLCHLHTKNGKPINFLVRSSH